MGFWGAGELGWELARNGKIPTHPSGSCQVPQLFSMCLLYPPPLPHSTPPKKKAGASALLHQVGREVCGHLDRPLRLEAEGAGKRPELLVNKAPGPHLKAGQVCISDIKQSGGKGQWVNSAPPAGGRTFAAVIFVLIFIQHLKYCSHFAEVKLRVWKMLRRIGGCVSQPRLPLLIHSLTE